ncbi:uncharacterized protein BDV17DRAFT_279242 [Aspergillus undulatus]|uniref:uncharacterized protein n=1 Tax=Aspergillus undulatus TaxID=1810928 RepID=UPI003CCCA53B
MSDLPSIEELERAAESGQRITPDDVSAIAQLEIELNGAPGDASATAQDFMASQMSFDAKLDQLVENGDSRISQQDAQEVHDLEGRAFHRTPGRASVAAQIRAIADRNEALGLPPVSADAPAAFVTQKDASDAQRAESRIYGGQNPRDGMAAQMQSAADKLEAARHEI